VPAEPARKDEKTAAGQGALQQAQHDAEPGLIGGKALSLVQKVLEVGIDGKGPFDSAHEVATAALAKAGTPDAAVSAIVKSHVKLAAASGFVTSLGGFITLPVALPANVTGFYVLATRMVAAIAKVRGFDLSRPQIRSAVLLTLVGADADDLLAKAGMVAPTGRLTALAADRLPGPALMVVNKAIGFRLLSSTGKSVFSRFGRSVPLVGGVVGAGLDGYLMHRISENARREFAATSAPQIAAH
jgi:hypothetical protein